MATTHSQKEKYQLQWNDGVLIDIPADLISNSTTFSNMFIDIGKELVIQCYSENIKGTDVKLYFQHYQSFLANHSAIDIIKLMDFLLIANYFDDSALLSTLARRIITSLHSILWQAKKERDAAKIIGRTDKMVKEDNTKTAKENVDKTTKEDTLKSSREKFKRLPPEIQNLILADLKKYAAIKGPHHIIRRAHVPHSKYDTMKDVLITNKGEIIAAIVTTRKSNSRTGKSNSPTWISERETKFRPKIYDESNSQRIVRLNKLIDNSWDISSNIGWFYEEMGGLTAEEMVWLFSRRELDPCASTDIPGIKRKYHFFLPDDPTVKLNKPFVKLIAHRHFAYVYSTPVSDHKSPIRNIIDISTNRLIHSIPARFDEISIDPTGRYFIGVAYYGIHNTIELFEIGKPQPIFQLTVCSVMGLLYKTVHDQGIEIDSYRQLIYLVISTHFSMSIGTSIRVTTPVIVLPVLNILNFTGQIVARYLVPDSFHIHFSADLIITSECIKSSTKLPLLEEINNIEHRPDCSLLIPPLQVMPPVVDHTSGHIIVERDINNGWRPISILPKKDSGHSIDRISLTVNRAGCLSQRAAPRIPSCMR